MPGLAAAACLPLMREVDSPQAKTEGEKRVSPPVFCFAKASPLVRGGLCIPPAMPVLMIESTFSRGEGGRAERGRMWNAGRDLMCGGSVRLFPKVGSAAIPHPPLRGPPSPRRGYADACRAAAVVVGIGDGVPVLPSGGIFDLFPHPMVLFLKTENQPLCYCSVPFPVLVIPSVRVHMKDLFLSLHHRLRKKTCSLF